MIKPYRYNNKNKGWLKKKINFTEIPDSWLIAIIPVISYAIVYLFYFGYLGYFKAPSDYLSFDLTSIFSTVLIILMLIFVWFIPGIYGVAYKPFNRISFRLFFSLTFFWALFYSITLPQNSDLRKIFGSIPDIVFILVIIVYSLLIPFEKPIFKKSSFYAIVLKIDLVISFIDRLIMSTIRLILQNFALRIFAVFLTILVVIGLGRFLAKNNTHFYTVNTNPERVVIYSSGDKKICALFNKENREVFPNFIIIDPSNSNNFIYTYEYIGHLNPVIYDQIDCKKCNNNEQYTFTK